jgi:DNA-directed RNA polymerase specialized sigma24 family protein
MDPLTELFDSADPERAEQRLVEAVDRLTSYFAWRGHRDADELASEVVVRAITQLSKGVKLERPDDPMRFLYGIARNVAFEAGRSRARSARQETIESYHERLETRTMVEVHVYTREALAALSPDDRRDLLEYIDGDREALRKRLRTSAAALRVKICNIRNALRRQREK